MIICAILIGVGIIATIITGVMVDVKPNPTPPLILSLYISFLIALSSIITFVVGHFTGM